MESWRAALDDRETSSVGMSRRVRSLERELARKDKALAEAAALLILKKRWTFCIWRQRTRRTTGDPRRYCRGAARRSTARQGAASSPGARAALCGNYQKRLGLITGSIQPISPRRMWPIIRGRCGFFGEDGHRRNETRGTALVTWPVSGTQRRTILSAGRLSRERLSTSSVVQAPGRGVGDGSFSNARVSQVNLWVCVLAWSSASAKKEGPWRRVRLEAT